ncbi:MAG: GNAT family N-acetyltransferase [Armatimonadota bacterium]|nr:GNAT family N-acetyltransferase [Armatimonadota bacterium]
MHIPQTSPHYPSHLEADVVLRDGSTVRIRPVRPDDEGDLVAFFRALSADSLAMRFFAPVTDHFLAEEAGRLVQVDYVRDFGMVATAGADERIVAHAMYAATDGDRAEVAFAIADDYQGRGLGTILLGQLAEVASANGIRVFEAEVLPANHRMLDVFRDSGFVVTVRATVGQLHVEFPTEMGDEALRRYEQREQVAAANAMRTFFAPRGVAVIGASRRRGTIGGEVFRNLLSYGFEGPVYPVNPAAPYVQGVVAYPTVEAIPGPVDLAVVVVPAAQVVDVARQCARKGIRALVVISSGFAEVGDDGRALQDELLAVCRGAGMRLIGPNCMGIVNTDPRVRLNATFAPVPPPPGRVGFMSQSGALGLAVMDYASALGLGLSTFVSVGNKADISGNDLLQYWETDERTDVILLYLESFGNPRKFSRIARRVGRSKPIVAVKSGRSSAGARATSSHTGALVAASDVTVDALFRQAGVIRTDTLEEMFDVAALLANQPPPRGRRVGIVTNAGGPGILCADACEAEGLQVPVLEESTRSRLRALLPPEASVANPVDMIASATADHYRAAIELVGEDANVDALVVIFIPPLATRPEDVARAIVEGARSLAGHKPVLAVFMSARGVPPELGAAGVRIPSYAFPEAAAIALARAARYGEWRARPMSAPPQLPDIRRDQAAAVVAAALQRGEGWLTADEVQMLLSCYGLPVLPQRTAADPEQAGQAAEEIADEVALKAVAPGLLHKTEVGGVRLHLAGRRAVAAAAAEMAERVRSAGYPEVSFLVQRMAPPGVEMIVGVVWDRQFGPVVACGAGGVLVELLHDVSVRIAPLTEAEASEMIEGLRTYPLLTGYRGREVYDLAALRDVVLRVGALVEDIPQIAEMDCNPVIVHRQGASIVDARVRVEPYTPAPRIGRRR